MNRNRRDASRTVGQSAVEMALVMPILVLLVFGVFELGRLLFIFSAVNNASREAARFGASTGADTGGLPNYLDCAAIRQRARETAFLAGLEDGDIQIAYEEPISGTMSVYAQCGDSGLDPNDVELGDRIVVTVTKNIEPILSFLPLPTFTPSFATARTILKGIVIGPVECSDDLDNDGDGGVDWDGGPDGQPPDTGCSGPNDTTEANCYRLTVVGSPLEGGNLSVNPDANCANRYIEQTLVSLGAYPAPLFTFNYWEIFPGGATIPITSTSITMDSDKDVVAHFRLITSDLAVSKSGPAQVRSLESFTYNISVSNLFTDTANSVVLTDTLPAGVAFQNWSSSDPAANCSGSSLIVCTVPSLPSPGTVTFDFEVSSPVANNSPLTITNTVSVSAEEFDPNLANNTAQAVTTVLPRADLTISKSGPTEVTAASNFDYTLTVNNLGPSLATGVVVTDILPVGMIFVSPLPAGCSTPELRTMVCDLPDLDVGVPYSFSFTVQAPPNGGLVVNTATVSSNEEEILLSDNVATFETQVQSQANLAMDKADSVGGNATRDVPFDYILTVSNAGPSTAVNITVQDTLPAGLQYNAGSSDPSCSLNGSTVTCGIGNLASGESRMVILNVTPTADGTLLNSASVSSDTDDPSLGNNNDSTTTNVAIDVTLSVSKTAPATVSEGADFAYTIALNNTGDSAATAVQLVDPLPDEVDSVTVSDDSAEWSCNYDGSSHTVNCAPIGGSFDGNSQVNVTISVTAADAGTASNTATLSSNEGVVADTATTTINPSLDLSVDIAGPSSGTVGVPFDYTVTVANSGPSEATSVHVVIDIDSDLTVGVGAVSAGAGWTCTQSGQQLDCDWDGSLAAGGTSTAITITVTPVAAGDLTSQAAVMAAESSFDTNSGNDTDTHSVTIA
jgi:uncharacterized repeat protein (TIGR01451 family)